MVDTHQKSESDGLLIYLNTIHNAYYIFKYPHSIVKITCDVV